MHNIRQAFIIVVGLGGVGSHAAHMLVRSGVQNIRLIDFDQVTLSSLNRHAVAVRADVGTPKVECMKKHLLEIMPHARIDARNTLFRKELAEELLEGNPTYVLDCIDNLDTKVDLVAYCHQKKLPVLVSMGAGARADPTRIRIADITETLEDGLSRAVRCRLRRHGVDSGVPCVFSGERTDVGLLPRGEHITDASEFQILPGFRVRIMPVLGPMPALFGNAMASHVLCSISNKPFEPYAVIGPGAKQYNKMVDKLKRKEMNVYGVSPMDFTLTEIDMRYVVEDMWRCRSSLSSSVHKLEPTRWDRSKPASITNLIVVNEHEMAKHDAITSLSEAYPPHTIHRINSRIEQMSKLADV